MTKRFYVEPAGELWTIHPKPPDEAHQPMYLTADTARQDADRHNRLEELREAIRQQVSGFATVNITQMGGGRLAWLIEFNKFDTIDGPRLILTDDTDDNAYTLGIYDTRQEVPGGPEPIIERTHLRVEDVPRAERTGLRSYRAATVEEVASFVADRARFIHSLAGEPYEQEEHNGNV